MSLIQEQIKKSDETKNKIIKTSIALFCEKGFDKTTMRDMADKAGIALGSYYYYFKSKEEVILAFYQIMQQEADAAGLKICEEKISLREKILKIIFYKFNQFADHKSLFLILAGIAGNTTHPLSPFSVETKTIREEAIGLLKKAIETSNVKAHKDLEAYLPHLFWFFQMGVIFYWVNDSSPGQKQTRILAETGLDILLGMLKLSSFPLVRGMRKKLVSLLGNFISKEKI